MPIWRRRCGSPPENAVERTLHPASTRAEVFAARLGLCKPVLLARMAGACPVGLPLAVARAGGTGAMGALLHDAAGIAACVADCRRQGGGALQSDRRYRTRCSAA